MDRALLVYDGRRPVFRAAMAAFTRGTGLVPVRWESATAQSLLEAQFGDRPFTFLLVEDDVVHAGSETVRRALDRRGVPAAGLAERLYPAIAGPFGRLVHGQEPADITGSFPLAEAAEPHAERLRRRYEVPVNGG
jgi:hypothetical protein